MANITFFFGLMSKPHVVIELQLGRKCLAAVFTWNFQVQIIMSLVMVPKLSCCFEIFSCGSTIITKGISVENLHCAKELVLVIAWYPNKM